MKLRSGSTPRASPKPNPTATTAAAAKSKGKRRASETDFDDDCDENQPQDATPVTTRPQRRRIADPGSIVKLEVEVEVEVVLPTPSKSKPTTTPKPPTPTPLPLAAHPINPHVAATATAPFSPSKPNNPPLTATTDVTQPAKAPTAQTECTTIVARDTESALIQSFLTHHLGPAPDSPSPPPPFPSPSTSIASSSLYICGSPGVGKTALVTQLLARYPSSYATIIHVNCFSLRPPEAVYARIVRLLSLALGVPEEPLIRGKMKEAVGVKAIEALICDHVVGSFASNGEVGEENEGPKTPAKKRGGRRAKEIAVSKAERKHPPCILVLDELDALYPTTLTSSSDPFPTVLYSLFSLAHKLSPRLSLIGIANALDLTARLLPHLAGPLTPITLTFHSYSVSSLVQVLQSRFGPSKLRPAAAMFIARSIAKDSSDVRKALAVARDALARARRAGKDVVDVKEVHEAIKGMAANAAAAAGASSAGAVSGVVVRVRAKPAHAKLALAALVRMVSPSLGPLGSKPAERAVPFAGQVDRLGVVPSPQPDAPRAPTTTATSPPTGMQLYNAYCTLVAQFPAVSLKPVQEAEFLDLVAVLEHDRLVRLLRPASGTAASTRSRRTGCTGAAAEAVKGMRLAKVVLEADALEVTRGLTTTGVFEEAEWGTEGAGRGKMVVEYVREVLGVDADES